MSCTPSIVLVTAIVKKITNPAVRKMGIQPYFLVPNMIATANTTR